MGWVKTKVRVTKRGEALERIDEYWNPQSWPFQWQQRYAALAAVLDDGATLEEILPGVTVAGQAIGAWLHGQRTGWEQLGEGSASAWPSSASNRCSPPRRRRWRRRRRPARGVTAAFERGIAALAQYKHREGHVKVPRAHTETVVVDDQEHAVKLNVFLSNTKSRRGKLTEAQRVALWELGMEWA